MDPWRQAALWAQEALVMVRHRTDTRISIDLAHRKLLTLRLVLRRLLEGALPNQINVTEIDVSPLGVGAGEFLEDALNSLVDEAVIHAAADIVLVLYGAMHHPNLRSTPWWEAWRGDHDVTAACVGAAIQRLRDALAQFKASVRALDRATTPLYPHLSAGSITLMLAAEQHLSYACDDARAASEEASMMGLAISLEHGNAERLLADGDI